MKCLVLKKPGELVVEEAPRPEPGPGEVLLRVGAVGICGSDVHSYLGQHPFVRYPVIPGHEFAGEIMATGDGVDGALAGRHACVEPSLNCGECGPCRTGRYNICENLRVMGFQAPGAMCEMVTVPAVKLHLLPPGVDIMGGALAEPAAVGVHAVKRGDVSPGEAALVIGGGVIGLMVLKALISLDCAVVVLEADPGRAKRALDFGAEAALVSTDDAARHIRQALGGATPDVVFECVGRPETAGEAIRLAPRGSTVVVAGVFPGPVPIPLSLVQDGEIDIRGTLMYMSDDFEKALELIATGAVSAADFVTHTVGLEEAGRGYRLLTDPEIPTLKVIVDLQGGP